MADPFELALVQGQTLRLKFAWRQPDNSYANFHDWDLFAQVRAKEDPTSELLLDVAPFIAVVDSSGSDGKFVSIVIPGSATAALALKPFSKGLAAWDIFAVLKADSTVDALLMQGPATLDPSATDMTGPEA